jgi:4'-phosphopantetheinyl transferase
VNRDTVQVWLIREDLPDPVVADLGAVLDDEERRRVEALRDARDRRRFVVAHGAARLIVAARLAAPAEQIRWERGPHGKPELAGEWTGLHVNLSHSGDLCMLAVTSHRRVGIDVQQMLPRVDVTGLAERYFPAAEARFVAAARGRDGALRRFTRLWARKEACVKAGGGRLTPGLRLPVRGRGPVVVDDPTVLPGQFLVGDLRAPSGYRAAVAVEGTAAYRVVRRCWPPHQPGRAVSADQEGPAPTSMADTHR